MRRALSWILGSTVLAFPATAQANAGIGVFSVASPVLVMALVPAILVEAPILSRLLGVGLRRGLWWSFLANLVSTILGMIIGIAADMILLMPSGSSGMTFSRTAVLISLVPMFFVTWWLEKMVVRRLQPKDATSSPRRATLAANAVSYSLLAAFIALVPSDGLDFPRQEARWRMTEVLATMGAAKTEVAEYFAAHKRFPEPGALSSNAKHVRSLRLEPQGRVVAEIHYPGTDELHGKHLVLEPLVQSASITSWNCHSPDMADRAHRYLPATCRQGPPAGVPPSLPSPPPGSRDPGKP